MEHSKQPFLKRLLSVRGMGAALTAFAGLIIIYIAFGLINPTVFSGRNIVNLTRSMSKYLIIGIGQSYLLITGNIDLSIGSVVGMSAMISGTLMSGGVAFLPGTLLGVLIQGVIQTFITFQGTLSAWWTRIIIALLLCLFIVIQAVVSRSRQRLNSEH